MISTATGSQGNKFTFGDWWQSMTTPVGAYEPQKVEQKNNNTLIFIILLAAIVTLGTIALILKKIQ